jgi:hypothetical protein
MPFLILFCCSQNILTDFKSIHSSKAFQLVNDQLQKSQAELDDHQTLLEKLQVVTGQCICMSV